MVVDPFLEAGIDIPKELPYQTPVTKRRKISTTNLVGLATDEHGINKSTLSLASVDNNNPSKISNKPLQNIRNKFQSQKSSLPDNPPSTDENAAEVTQNLLSSQQVEETILDIEPRKGSTLSISVIKEEKEEEEKEKEEVEENKEKTL